MKVKVLALLALAVFALSSCEKIKDLASVEVETKVSASINPATIETSSVEIPLQTVQVKSATVNGNKVVFHLFKGVAEIDLRDNASVGQYVDGIIDFKVVNGEISLGGMQTGDSIYGLKISAEGIDKPFVVTSVVMFTDVTCEPFSPKNLSKYISNFETKLQAFLNDPDLINYADCDDNMIGWVPATTKSATLEASTAAKPTLPLDPSGVNAFLKEWKDLGYGKVRITMEGYSNFDVDNKLKAEISMPSNVKYSPL